MGIIVKEDLVGLGQPWTRLHRRVYDHPGAIVDLGCASWDWSQRFFFGKQHVVGVDPFETDPDIEGVDLFQGVVTSVRGQVLVSREGIGSSTRSPVGAVAVESITLADLLARYSIDQVAALKINTEGSEYEILIHLTDQEIERIDQIAVSFHDFKGIGSPGAVEAVRGFLSRWYDVASIDARWSWYLFVKKN